MSRPQIGEPEDFRHVQHGSPVCGRGRGCWCAVCCGRLISLSGVVCWCSAPGVRDAIKLSGVNGVAGVGSVVVLPRVSHHTLAWSVLALVAVQQCQRFLTLNLSVPPGLTCRHPPALLSQHINTDMTSTSCIQRCCHSTSYHSSHPPTLLSQHIVPLLPSSNAPVTANLP